MARTRIRAGFYSFFSKRLRPVPALAAVLLLVLATGARAQPSLMVNVGPCITLETAVERYTCYEQQVNAALNGALGGQNTGVAPANPGNTPNARSNATPPASNPPVTIARPGNDGGTNAPAAGSTTTSPSSSVRTVPRDAVSNEDTFGFPPEEIERRRGEPEPVQEVTSIIADVEEILPNQYRITLENGQIWRQSRPEPSMRLETGQHVRIYPTRWGDDMRMSVEELNGFVQVSRLR